MTQWQTIDSAPKDGTRVRLAHEKDPSSMKVNTICPTYGTFGDGAWDLNSFFTPVFNGRAYLVSEPTHWMPVPPPSEVTP